LFVPAKIEPRAPHGFFARQAGLEILLHLLIEMEAQLCVRFGFDSLVPE
jgi:hypothetical protein